jgi:alanine racemase
MSRSGFRCDDRAAIVAVARRLGSAKGWEGIFTHFHSADCDSAATETQWSRFDQVVHNLPRRPSLVHAANSAAALCGERYAADLVRPGVYLYGGCAGAHDPEPVASLRTRVVALRRVEPGETVSYGASWCAERSTTIATLGLGYGDGLPRAVDRARAVELNGRVVPVIGRVAMDMTMVALEQGQPVAVGDVATIFGGAISLSQQAASVGTIPYELLTSLGARVVRRYSGDWS